MKSLPTLKRSTYYSPEHRCDLTTWDAWCPKEKSPTGIEWHKEVTTQTPLDSPKFDEHQHDAVRALWNEWIKDHGLDDDPDRDVGSLVERSIGSMKITTD